MSLLPSKMQIDDPLTALGALRPARKAAAPTAAEIAAHESFCQQAFSDADRSRTAASGACVTPVEQARAIGSNTHYRVIPS